MRIYKLLTHSGYRYPTSNLVNDLDIRVHRDYELNYRGHYGKDWTPLTIVRVPTSRFPGNQLTVPISHLYTIGNIIVSEDVQLILEEAFPSCFSYLEFVTVTGLKYYRIYAKYECDCFDRKSSLFSDIDVKRQVFHSPLEWAFFEQKIIHPVFSLPFSWLRIYVTDEFRDKIRKLVPPGFDFKLLWDSKTGPVKWKRKD